MKENKNDEFYRILSVYLDLFNSNTDLRTRNLRIKKIVNHIKSIVICSDIDDSILDELMPYFDEVDELCI